MGASTWVHRIFQERSCVEAVHSTRAQVETRRGTDNGFEIGKKNRFLTCSRPPPSRGLVEVEPDDVYSRPGNLYFLPRTGGWSGKIRFFPSPSVVCHRLNNSLCLPVFPSFLASQWAGIIHFVEIFQVLGIDDEIVYGTIARYSFREFVWRGIGLTRLDDSSLIPCLFARIDFFAVGILLQVV